MRTDAVQAEWVAGDTLKRGLHTRVWVCLGFLVYRPSFLMTHGVEEIGHMRGMEEYRDEAKALD